jgi:beta-lactamase class A
LIALTSCGVGPSLLAATPETLITAVATIPGTTVTVAGAIGPTPTAPSSGSTAATAASSPTQVARVATPSRNTSPEPSQHTIAVLGPPPVIATRPATPTIGSGAPSTPDCGPNLQVCLATLVGGYEASSVAGVVITEGDGVPVAALNADREFATASLYKLFVLWGVQRAIADGDLDDDTLLTFTAEDDNSEDDGYLPWAIGDQVSVAEARELMITVSNNSAAWLLARTVGWGEIDRLLHTNGFPESLTVEGVSTPREIAAYFDGILTGTLDPRLRAADYEMMLDLLLGQLINSYLSPGFPSNASFAHKTGNLPGVVNDAGILFLPDGRTVTIAVLTEGNEGASLALLEEIAATVWEFYGR